MAFTGRLGNYESRLEKFQLGSSVSAVPPPPPPTLPFIDLPTAVVVAPHGTSLVAFRRTSSVTVFPRRTSLAFD